MDTIQKMRSKLIFLLFLFSLIIIPSVLALPPFISTGQTFTEGLVLDFQVLEVAKINATMGLVLHTFNISNGLIIGSPEVSCTGHVYDINGSNLFQQQGVPQDSYFTFYINENNITQEGYYTYSLHCNTSKLGGYASGGFWATYNGMPPPADFTQSFFIIGFMVLLFLTIMTILNLTGHMIEWDVDIKDVGYMISIYASWFALHFFNTAYMGSKLIETFCDIFIFVGAGTHILVPIILFVITNVKRQLEAKKKDH